MTQSSDQLSRRTGSDDRLCAGCHRIHVTEGQIPAYCSHCDPPRLSPAMKRLVTYGMLGRAFGKGVEDDT